MFGLFGSKGRRRKLAEQLECELLAHVPVEIALAKVTGEDRGPAIGKVLGALLFDDQDDFDALGGVADSEAKLAAARLEDLLDVATENGWTFAHELAHLVFFHVPGELHACVLELYERSLSALHLGGEYQRSNDTNSSRSRTRTTCARATACRSTACPTKKACSLTRSRSSTPCAEPALGRCEPDGGADGDGYSRTTPRALVDSGMRRRSRLASGALSIFFGALFSFGCAGYSPSESARSPSRAPVTTASATTARAATTPAATAPAEPTGRPQPPEPPGPRPTVDADPPGERPAANSVRLIVMAESGELLGSETRALDKLVSALEQAGQTVQRVDAGADEIGAMQELERGQALAVLAASWRSSATVALLRIAKFTKNAAGKRVPGGVSGVFILRPPAREPLLALFSDERAAPGLDAEFYADLVKSHLAAGTPAIDGRTKESAVAP